MPEVAYLFCNKHKNNTDDVRTYIFSQEASSELMRDLILSLRKFLNTLHRAQRMIADILGWLILICT